MFSRLKKEFTDPENLKDAERGVFLGLVVGTILAALFTTSDYLALNFDYIRGQNPYGILWYFLNLNFWTDVPYRTWITGLLLISEFWTWYLFVRTKRLNKFLFYAGWFQSLIWIRGSVYQNVTVTMLAPLGSIAPWFIVPFMLLQKLPIGWSWNFSDAHWWCAFTGNSGFTAGDTITFPNGQQLISCPGGWLRWNPAYSWFWSYAMIMFWLIVPTLFWLKPRIKKWRISRMDDDGNIEGWILKRPICWVKGCNPYIWARMFFGKGFWICSRCGKKCGRIITPCDDCGTRACDGRCEDDE